MSSSVRVRAGGGADAPAGAASAAAPRPKFGIFCCSASPAIAEALSVSGLDWICVDAQHGAVSYDVLAGMLAATDGGPAKRIVRVGGPDDRFGMQQALDLGADGVMVPLVYSREDAVRAVSYCKYPPEGLRSAAYPVRAVYRKGVGTPALAQYLRDANRETEVWLQVETKECFEAVDDVLSVPGVSCAFLGPADLGFAHGLHVEMDYDLPGMLASTQMEGFYATVLAACRRHGVAPGAFCIGRDRAAALSAMGYEWVGFDTDLNALITYAGDAARGLR
ncbi:MAG: Pyruvate/Phosphoenolpyruvate kinase-like domain-containing protein [Monoraphidium minutum]|nr:MAG: Pyruvate/Phosphoenolpyruvate kinase-like domain-containing protein [Monoraphidium minutum]